jgi:hypothetical protein
MKRFGMILVAGMMLLSACAPLGTPTQSNAQAVSDLVATGVAATLTAMPTATPIPPTEPPPLPTPTLEPVPPTAPPPTSTPVIVYVYPTVPPPTSPPVIIYVYPSPQPAQTPAQFIYYYYSLINNRQYDLAWSFLTPDFIARNNSPEEGGYAGYVNYWNTVQSVVVTSVVVLSQRGTTASVRVYATYNYFSGASYDTQLVFYLVYDYTRGTWLFQ